MLVVVILPSGNKRRKTVSMYLSVYIINRSFIDHNICVCVSLLLNMGQTKKCLLSRRNFAKVLSGRQ